MPRKKKNAATTNVAPELEGMPDTDPIAKVARRYLNALGDKRTAQEAIDQAATELMPMMTDLGKKTLTIDGFVIERNHKDASDKLKVKAIKTDSSK